MVLLLLLPLRCSPPAPIPSGLSAIPRSLGAGLNPRPSVSQLCPNGSLASPYAGDMVYSLLHNSQAGGNVSKEQHSGTF